MFLSKLAFRSNQSVFMEEDESLWHAVRLISHQPWFVVTVERVDSSTEEGPDISVHTLLAGGVSDLVRLNAGITDPMTTFRDVYVVLPDYLNKSNGWEMQRLRTVWVAEDQHQFGIPAHIYEDMDGRIYCNPRIEPLLQDIRKRAPLLSF